MLFNQFKAMTEFIKESEAIALTGYSRVSLYKFRRDGIIKWTCAKSGRKTLYDKSSLLELIGQPQNNQPCIKKN